jgi:hypothetical protein
VRALTEEETLQHEILEKLTAIVGYCELVGLEEDLHAVSKERLDRVVSFALDTSELIRLRTCNCRIGEKNSITTSFVASSPIPGTAH